MKNFEESTFSEVNFYKIYSLELIIIVLSIIKSIT